MEIKKLATFRKAIIGPMAIALASLLGAYGSARSTYQPQPPVPGIAELIGWILQFNDPLALGMVLLTTITTGLSIWQATTSLTKKDVCEVVNSDGELTRDQITVGRDQILEAISKLESDRVPSPRDAIETIVNASRTGLLEPDDFLALHKVILRSVIAEHNPPTEVLKAFERELSEEGSGGIFVDSLRDLGGESRAKIVSERVKNIESGQTNLAEQYAGLAAFTAIEEPFRAIAFYRKALALDVTNAKFANALGQLLLLYGTVSEAREFFEVSYSSASSLSDGVDLAYGLSTALLKEGNSEAAKAVLSESLTTSESSVLADPLDPYWLHQLISLNLRLAEFEKNHGQRLLEVQFLEDCFTAHGRLKAIGHICAGGDRAIGEAHVCRGKLQLAIGDTEGATRDFQNAIDIYRSLVSEYPDYSDYERGLLSSNLQMALLHRVKGELSESDIQLQEALQTTSSLLAKYPNNKLCQRDQLIINLDRAIIRIKQGRLDEADDILEMEEDKIRTHFENDRSDSQSQRDLSIVLEYRGDIDKSKHLPEDALLHYQESLDLRDSLFESDSSDMNAQRDVAVASAKIGSIHINNKRFDAANKYLSKAQDIYLERLSRDPESADTNYDVYDVTQLIGHALWGAGLRHDALEIFKDAHSMIASLSRQHPEIEHYAKDVGDMADLIARLSAPV